MEEYKKWLKTWEYIHGLNQSDIFMYGRAIYNGNGDITVVFDEKEQRDNYHQKFPKGY